MVLLASAGAPEAVATQDQPVIAGQPNTEGNTTSLSLPCPNGSCFADSITALLVENLGGSNNTNPTAIWGNAGELSFFAYPPGGAGVLGTSAVGSGVEGDGTPNGVFGHASNAVGSGVYGQNDGMGFGVAGRSTSVSGGTGVLGDAPIASNGVGVEADSAHGTALRTKGKVSFNRSGIATVAGTSTTPKSSVVVTVPGNALTSASLILATIQGNIAGVSVQGVVKGTTSFTISLTKTVTTSVRVGWFIIN